MKRTSIYTQIDSWWQSIYLHDKILCNWYDRHSCRVKTGTVTYIHPNGYYYNVTFDHGITRSVLAGARAGYDVDPIRVVGRPVT